jgi:stage II sporulation protein E
MLSRKKQAAQIDLVLEEITKDTKNRIKELAFSYEKLSQILKKMPASEWTLNQEEAEQVLGRVSLEACKGCGKFYDCYRKENQRILREVLSVLRLMERRGTIEEEELPSYLKENCIRRKDFFISLIQSYEIISVHKIWSNKMLYQRRAMASQMEQMSSILFGCSIMLGFDKTKEGKAEKMFRKLLKKEKILIGPIRFYENSAKKQEVLLLAVSKQTNYPVDKVASILSRCLGKNMIPAEDCSLSVYHRNTLLRFEEDRNYCLLSGTAGIPRKDSEVSGDIFSVMKLKEGRQVCILADGMGTGAEAREESRCVVELMEQFLQAGFKEEETIHLANSMLTFGVERNRYSSFDFFSFHLYTGMLKIMKSGSAATFILRKDEVDIIESRTPPAGLLWEVEFDVLYKKLYDGDKIVLISDGVADHIGGDNPEKKLAAVLPDLCEGTPQQSADAVLAWVMEQNPHPPADDMSVLVTYIWKKKHTY